MHEQTQLILAATAARLLLDGKSGFVPMSERRAALVLERAGLWFGPRAELENEEGFRQIIPYVVLQVGSHLVRYTRTRSGKEARLHDLVSIGLGGHVDLSDVVTRDSRIDLLGTLGRAAKREVSEEVGNLKVEHMRWIGMLVDDTTAVGRVHVGFVALWRLGEAPNRRPEEAIGGLETEAIADLEANLDRLETWSAMLLPYLAALCAESVPLTRPTAVRES